jgi:hypothetical protein
MAGFAFIVKNRRDPRLGRDRPHRQPSLYFASIYVVVAGLALTIALSDFSANSLNNFLTFSITENDLKSLTYLISFLAISLHFFHVGLIFLTTNAAHEFLTTNAAHEGQVRTGKRLIMIFMLILFQSTLILFSAVNTNNSDNFIKIVVAIFIANIVWFLLSYKGKFFYLEWLHFDLLTLSFLLIMYNHQLLVTGILLSIVLTFRTVCDYYSLWNRFWSRYPITDI